jgi:3-dehydroquinate synthase
MASVETPGDPHFVVSDAVALPDAKEVVEARACRNDVYPIIVTRSGRDTVERLGELELRSPGDRSETVLTRGARVAIITDRTVDALYGEGLRGALRRVGITFATYLLPPGEATKSTHFALELWDWLAASDIGRRDLIVTHGGGVINDLGGWVASAYMRGLCYVNLPTTLLAQVDGAMGGKVAANHPSAKNLLGAFHQPSGVISNVGYLASLDRRHLAAGLAESIKKAIIASPAYWEFIEGHADEIVAGDIDALEWLVRCAAKIKTVLVERDPYEEDLRRPLNFGHTVGHPLETVTGYGPLLHGEAVAFGMVVESRISANRGLLDLADLERIIALLDRVGLPTASERLPVEIDGDAIVAAMGKVKLIRAGSLRYVLPKRLGETVIADDVSSDELRTALAETGVRDRIGA